MKQQAAKDELNPKTLRYDFHGPFGALLTALGVPCLALVLYFSCSEFSGGCPPTFSFSLVVQTLQNSEWWGGLWDTRCSLIFLAWYTFCLFSWWILPGQWVNGTKLRNGSHQLYKLNGFYTYLLVLCICALVIQSSGAKTFTSIHLNQSWPQYIIAGVALAFIESLYCYAKSFKHGALLSLGGNSGNVIYDWFVGRELNTSIVFFDLKYFHCLRFALMSWAVADISMLCEQANRLGGFDNVSNSMWLIVNFQLFYIGDALYNEESYLTSMDIIHEGFGFMLALGHFVVVPFTFSLHARYLAFQPQELSPIWAIIVTTLKFVGYYIYRVSNAEKHAFRNGQNPKNLQSLETKAGSRLIVSGWWGWSRHPNYFGDLLISFAWCLTTGFKSPIPYFYAAFLTGLLTSRQQRDEEICAAKYGKDWVKYKQRVPYRIIRYIY